MQETMKAMVYREYGPPSVLHLEDIPMPNPKADEVLIKVRATTVTTGDVNLRGFKFVPRGLKFVARLVFGIIKPNKTILGTEVAGDVIAVGSKVTRFKAGDAVFGIGSSQLGAYAEYVCRKAEGSLALKPKHFSYEEAAAIPFGAGTALYFLKQLGKVQAGQRVLINGASGGVGNYAVQIAAALGAEVTGVCSSRNVEFVKSLGAQKIIDYSKEDFSQQTAAYDLILDTVVGKMTYEQCKNALKATGTYLAVAGGLPEMLQSIWNKKIIAGTPSESKAMMEALLELVEAGKIKAVIDRCYPLEELAEAHSYVETARKRGNIVITLPKEGSSS